MAVTVDCRSSLWFAGLPCRPDGHSVQPVFPAPVKPRTLIMKKRLLRFIQACAGKNSENTYKFANRWFQE